MDRREFIEYLSLLCGINLVPKELREYKSPSKCSPESSSHGSSASTQSSSYCCFSSCSSSLS